MAEDLELKLSNRGKRGAIKKLPPSITVPATATLEDVKKLVAKRSGLGDFNRVGVFNPTTNKTYKDRLGLVREQEDIIAKKTILVKDLGTQLSWRFVYLVEYLGPILFHGLLYNLYPHISLPFFFESTATTPLTPVQRLLFWIFTLHFLKREAETAFLHRFSANTLPAWNIIRNSAYYWLMAGLLCSLSIYATWSPTRFFPFGAARQELGTLDYAMVGVWAICEALNLRVHWHLAGLRRPGTTEKGIPSCIGSDLVTCPNYGFEIVAWVAAIVIARDVTVVAFICTGTCYMITWSRGKEMDLRKRFPGKYKAKRYRILPGLF